MRDKRQIHSLRLRALRALAARPKNISELQVALRETDMGKVRREVREQLRNGLLQRDGALRYSLTPAGMAFLERRWPVAQMALDLGGELCA